MGRACLVVLLLASSAVAQIDSGKTIRHLTIRLKFSDGVCDPSAHVLLVGGAGPLVDHRPDDQCEVEFLNLPSGTYHVEVSGEDFNRTEEVITTTEGTSDFEFEIKAKNDGMSRATAGAVVSAADLSVPAKAMKEFDKSNEHLNRLDFGKAIQSLNRAIAIYPSYAAAYNNLGAIYGRLGDHDKEREALEKAVRVNDRFAPAYLNLGRMNIASGNFPAAEDALNKAVANSPSDPMAMVLLCYSQFQDRHFDDAIASSHKAHALSGQHSSVHVIAAKIFEQKHDAPDAIAELELFLKEEPTGQRADQARKDLTILRAIHQ